MEVCIELNFSVPAGNYHVSLQQGSFTARLIRLQVFLKPTALMRRTLSTKQLSSKETSY
jgi:hypothetical protein